MKKIGILLMLFFTSCELFDINSVHHQYCESGIYYTKKITVHWTNGLEERKAVIENKDFFLVEYNSLYVTIDESIAPELYSVGFKKTVTNGGMVTCIPPGESMKIEI